MADLTICDGRGVDPSRSVAGLLARLLEVCGSEGEDAPSERLEHVRQLLQGALRREMGTAGPRAPVDLEALGELFGDLSRLCHKINNPLTSIMGRAQMMRHAARPGVDPKSIKAMEVIDESAQRVAALVQEVANLVCVGRKEFVESYDSKTGSRWEGRSGEPRST